ncbi:MAG: hypothetical protein KUG56_02115, partial [Kordiimonadaceae bacterium]|nr:hypothetical protein [Kordiimonadaceae bacterium]
MAEIVHHSDFVCVEEGSPSALVRFLGCWTIDNAQKIDDDICATLGVLGEGAVLDCTGITMLDTTGAVLIRRFAAKIEEAGAALLTGVSAEHKHLLEVIHSCPPPALIEPEQLPWYLAPLDKAGGGFWKAVRSLARLLAFL